MILMEVFSQLGWDALSGNLQMEKCRSTVWRTSRPYRDSHNAESIRHSIRGTGTLSSLSKTNSLKLHDIYATITRFFEDEAVHHGPPSRTRSSCKDLCLSATMVCWRALFLAHHYLSPRLLFSGLHKLLDTLDSLDSPKSPSKGSSRSFTQQPQSGSISSTAISRVINIDSKEIDWRAGNNEK